MIFLEYPKCTTCIKAKKYLNENNVEYSDRDIVKDNPSLDELSCWYNNSDIELKKLFNTSGKLYKEMKLSTKLKELSDEEKLKLLASDGKLVKRPLIVENNKILSVGFKEEDYQKYIKRQKYLFLNSE